MMTAIPSTTGRHEEPLISARFLTRVTIVVAILALSTIAISVAGRWFGQRLTLAGHTESTTPVVVTIGQDALMLPVNTIRFASQRRTGLAERVDLYLTWPEMAGFSAPVRQRFDDINQASGLLFLQITQSTMSRDMSGRLEPIYAHLIDGAPLPVNFGLTLHKLRSDTGYGGEVLLTAPVAGGETYVVRCLLPKAGETATSGDCQRDIKIGRDLSVLYRFSSERLADWASIDKSVRSFVSARLVGDAPATPLSPPTGG